METFFIKNRIAYSTAVLLVGFISLVFMMQSCSSNDGIVNEPVEFLDLDISALSSEIQESDRLIIEAARNRIEPYVTYKNDLYEISIKNGRQIQISDRLFQIFINAIESSNQSLGKLKSNTGIVIVQDVKDEKILHIVKRGNFVRLKSGSPESPIAIGSSGIDWRWYGWDLYLTNQAAKDYAYNVNNAATAYATLAAGSAFFGQFEITLASGLTALWFENIADRVTYYNGPNGVIIRSYAGIPFVYSR
jgi:hypothetical protein